MLMNLLVSSLKICVACLGVDYLSFSLSISSFNLINQVVLANVGTPHSFMPFDWTPSCFIFIRFLLSTSIRSIELFWPMQQVRASICHPTGLPVFSVYSVITSIRLFRVVLADAASERIYLQPDWTPSFFIFVPDRDRELGAKKLRL